MMSRITLSVKKSRIVVSIPNSVFNNVFFSSSFNTDSLIDKCILIDAAKEHSYIITPEEDDNYEYLDILANMEVELSNIRRAAAKVKKMAIKRELYKRTLEVQSNLK